MANFCSHCGAASKPGANFCERCGARLAPEADQPQPAAVPEQDNPYRRGNIGSENFGPGENGGREGANGVGYTVNAGSAYDPFPESGLIQQFFTVRGRLNRWRYFNRCMAIWAMLVLMFIVSVVLLGTNHAVLGVLTLFSILIGGAVAPICLVIRRFHDMEPADSSGSSFMVTRLGAYAGFIIASWFWEWAVGLSALMSLYLMFNPGVTGANRHGADPLAN